MDLGLQMRDMGMSLEDAYKEETPQNLTPKLQRSWQKKYWPKEKLLKCFKQWKL